MVWNGCCSVTFIAEVALLLIVVVGLHWISSVADGVHRSTQICCCAHLISFNHNHYDANLLTNQKWFLWFLVRTPRSYHTLLLPSGATVLQCFKSKMSPLQKRLCVIVVQYDSFCRFCGWKVVANLFMVKNAMREFRWLQVWRVTFPFLGTRLLRYWLKGWYLACRWKRPHSSSKVKEGGR